MGGRHAPPLRGSWGTVTLLPCFSSIFLYLSFKAFAIDLAKVIGFVGDRQGIVVRSLRQTQKSCNVFAVRFCFTKSDILFSRFFGKFGGGEGLNLKFDSDASPPVDDG
jgi:hypothetical protein